MLNESERLERISKAHGVSIVAQVEVDVEVSADNYWTAVGHKLLKHRRQLVEKLGRQQGTSGPVDAEQHELTVGRQRIAVQVLECRWTVIENSLLKPDDITVDKGKATVILEVDPLPLPMTGCCTGCVMKHRRHSRSCCCCIRQSRRSHKRTATVSSSGSSDINANSVVLYEIMRLYL